MSLVTMQLSLWSYHHWKKGGGTPGSPPCSTSRGTKGDQMASWHLCFTSSILGTVVGTQVMKVTDAL